MGRIREGSEEVCEEADVVCSVRIVLLWAMQALWGVCQWLALLRQYWMGIGTRVRALRGLRRMPCYWCFGWWTE